MKRNVLVVSAFVNPFIKDNSRVHSIIEGFNKNGYIVTLVTTNFDHQKKRFYDKTPKLEINSRLIKVTSYRRNISIKRIISHLFFAFRLKKYFKKEHGKYDVVYCTTPTTLSSYFLTVLSKKYSIKLVLDVIDLWPESYFIFFKKFKPLAKLALYPWTFFSRQMYRNADIVIAESQQYASYIENIKKEKVNYYYIGVNRIEVKNLIESSTIEIEKKDGEIWICYGGSLGRSYDFDIILNSFYNIQEKFANTRLLFIGGGEMQSRITDIINKKKLKAVVTGLLQYKDYLKWLSKCDIAINSFHKDTIVVHSYKFNDYVANGCCVLNNLKGETWQMVEKFGIGLNFDHEENTLEKCLIKLLSKPQLIDQYKEKSIYLADNDLSKEQIYQLLFNELKFSIS